MLMIQGTCRNQSCLLWDNASCVGSCYYFLLHSFLHFLLEPSGTSQGFSDQNYFPRVHFPHFKRRIGRILLIPPQSPVLLQTATAKACSSRDLGLLPPPLQQEPLASPVAAPMALEHLYGGVHAPSSNRKAGGVPNCPLFPGISQLLEGLCGEVCRGGPARCPTPAPGEQGALVQPRPYATGQLLPPEGRKTLMETITQLSVTAQRACFSL